MPNATQQAVDDPETKQLFIESWPKTCGCGEVFSEHQWENLRYVGVQKMPADYGLPDMELRNCSRCGSTMAVVVPYDFVD